MKNITNSLVILLLGSLISYFVPAQEKVNTGTLVVVNKREDTVSFIDLASRDIVFTRATGKGPHELAITEDGKWAVITDYVGGNSLSVFDVQQAKKVRTIDLSSYPRPHGILFFKDQQRVAVSSEGSDSVVIVDITSGNIVKAINTQQKGSHMVALPASSERVYTTNMESNTVSELELSSKKLLRIIPMPEMPEAIAVNASGTELWVGSNADGLVTVFDLTNGSKIKQWQGFRFPYRILLTRDQRYAVIPDFRNNTLDIIDVNQKTKLNQVTFEKGTVPNGVTFHPDDRTLFMSANGKNKVWVIDIPTGKFLFELPTGEGPDGIGYSSLQMRQN